MWFSPSLSLLFLHSTSVIAPSPPGWQTVSRAMGPRVGMYCAGGFPDGFHHLLNPNHNRYVDFAHPLPFYQNLLHLCASTTFGGRVPSAGAQCSSLTKSPFTVLFDYRGQLISNFLIDDRLILYCYNKCWCTGGHAGDVPLIGRFPLELPTVSAYRRVDPDQLSSPGISASIRSITEQELDPGDQFLNITILFETLGLVSRYQAVIVKYTGKTEGRVRCEGPVPMNPIPRAVGMIYDNIQEVCAAGIYGGSSNGNLGGYCIARHALGKNYYSSSFLLDGSIQLAEANLLVYCHAFCYCADSEPISPEADFYERKMVGAAQVADLTRNGNRLQVNSALWKASFSVLRLPEGYAFIEAEGNRELQAQNGEIYTVDIDPNLSEPPTQQCPIENPCSGPTDCPGCVCHVASSKSSVDPISRKMVFPYGGCGSSVAPAVDTVAGLMNQHSLLFQTLFRAVSSGILSGRAVGHTEDGKEDRDGLFAACACNASYVSAKCCQAMDGFIWETPELQLGYVAQF